MINAKTVGYKQTESGEAVRLDKIIESINAGQAPLPQIVPSQIAEIMQRNVAIANQLWAVQDNISSVLSDLQHRIENICEVIEIDPNSETNQANIARLTADLRAVITLAATPYETASPSDEGSQS